MEPTNGSNSIHGVQKITVINVKNKTNLNVLNDQQVVGSSRKRPVLLIMTSR